MKFKLIVVTSVFAVSVVASAQLSRVAWTRNSGSPGVNIDTARSGIVDSNGKFVIVGAVKPVALPWLGAMAAIDRRTATAIQNTFPSPLGGPLEFTKIVQHQSFYFVFGTTRAAAGNIDQIYIAKIDSNLNLVVWRTFQANTYAGHERVTDAKIDSNGNIYMTGVAQKNNIWQMFVAKTDISLIPLNQTFGKVDFPTYNEPQLELNGLASVFVGFVGPTWPTMRLYNPAGGLLSQMIVNHPGSNFRARFAFNPSLGRFYCAFSLDDTTMLASSGGVTAHSPANLAQTHGIGLPLEPGLGSLKVVDVQVGDPTQRPVNTLFQRSSRAALQTFDSALVSLRTWYDPVPGTLPAIGSIAPWGDAVLMLSRGTNQVNGIGLSAANATRFSLFTPAYNLLLPSMEQENLYHPGSGDILNVRTDDDRMQVTCFQQAPVAITNSYSPKSGQLFRPLLPVTANDRFADGSAIAIVQQPAHGVVTIGTNGYFNYTSAPGYTGPDSFRYQLTKPGLTPSAATINLTVVP